MTSRKFKSGAPKHQQQNENTPSLFSQAMSIKEKAQLYHQETDDYLKNFKRQLLLAVLLQIKENPPPYIADNPSGPRAIELNNTIAELKKIIESEDDDQKKND